MANLTRRQFGLGAAGLEAILLAGSVFTAIPAFAQDAALVMSLWAEDIANNAM